MTQLTNLVLKEKFKFPDLMQVLQDAPMDVEFSHNPWGIHVINDIIKINYSVAYRNISLCFLKLDPQITVTSRRPNLREIPEGLNADILSVGERSLYLYPESYEEQKGEEEYFSKGTEILRNACRKYNFAEYYSTWIIKESLRHLPISEEMKKRIRISFD
ncbi:MAG: hypothetical protein WCK90_04470 [archaeon]